MITGLPAPTSPIHVPAEVPYQGDAPEIDLAEVSSMPSTSNLQARNEPDVGESILYEIWKCTSRRLLVSVRLSVVVRSSTSLKLGEAPITVPESPAAALTAKS